MELINAFINGKSVINSSCINTLINIETWKIVQLFWEKWQDHIQDATEDVYALCVMQWQI